MQSRHLFRILTLAFVSVGLLATVPYPSSIYLDSLIEAAPLAAQSQLDDESARVAFEASGRLRDPREVNLSQVRQMTYGGENAEAYWSPDARHLIFQSTRPGYECDQMFTMSSLRAGQATLVSTGEGRTTCGYFSYPEGERIYYASTHEKSRKCPPAPDRSQGYVWPIYDSYEIYSAKPDGSDLVRLTKNKAYDAEATVCPIDGSVIFTSTRDGDLDLYRMDADGSNVQRLTDTLGYDGGAFFSPDCSQIVWRASRFFDDASRQDYQRLLKEDLIRPGELEIWVANADGTHARQVTYLGAASFAPSFYPSGDRIIFSSNYGNDEREFDLWAVDLNGTNLERITYAPGFDGFPLFSPNAGLDLVFASNRNQGKPGETDLYLARWVGYGNTPKLETGADRVYDDIAWLANDVRQGRGVGTEGLRSSADWLGRQFQKAGLRPAGEKGFLQRFQIPTEIDVKDQSLVIDGEEVDPAYFQPAAFSGAGSVDGELVDVGYGISAPELEVDDYEGLDVTGKIVLVRRFAPTAAPFDDTENQRRYSDLRYKAFNAREKGAAGMIVVDAPLLAEGEEMPEEAGFPPFRVDAKGDAGMPVVYLERQAGAEYFANSHTASIQLDLEIVHSTAHNVIGRLPSLAADRKPGAILIGAHYDHLGLGGPGSLAPGVEEVHNGADDNASGTAALLEIARQLVPRQEELPRDVYFVAFAGEEVGLIGSTHFSKEPTGGVDLENLVAMINLDMVGRMENNVVSVLGGESAEEWSDLVAPICSERGVRCEVGGTGYGRSDQTPFYAAGIPVLHFFSGTHEDYHRPSDDLEHINAGGAAQIAAVIADVTGTLAARDELLTYRSAPPRVPRGDTRSSGASLGSIPDYSESDEPGVLFAGVRPGGPADLAGMQRGDRLVKLGGTQIKNLYDMMFVLRRAEPGTKAKAVVVREGERVEMEVTLGQPSRM